MKQKRLQFIEQQVHYGNSLGRKLFSNSRLTINVMLIFLFLFVQSLSMAQTYTWKNVNLQGMGYVSGIAVHPSSKDIYIRMDVGGAMRWDAANNQWLPITDAKIQSYNVEAIALNPSNANDVFIVCGNMGAGQLYKSSNKGDTWELVSSNFNPYVAGNSAWRNDDPRLAIDPNNGGQVMFYASRQDGLWKSINSGVDWVKISTSVISAGVSASGGQAFVVFDKNSGNSTTNSTTLYVGVAGSGVYKSTNGGTSFSLLTNGPTASTYTPVAGAIGSNSVFYVTYCKSWNDGADVKVYRFSTAGAGTNITPANNNGMSFGPIDICDTDPNKIVTFQWRFGETKGIHYSSDGGNTWSAKTCSFSNFNAPSWWDKSGVINWDYCGGIAFDPDNSNKIWFTTGHGVFTTENITAINPVYNTQMQGLEEMVILQICVPPLPNTTDVFIALADQQGFTVADRDLVPTESWSAGQFGMASSIDYCVANPNFMARVSDNEQWTNPAGYGKYSTNGGASWSSFSTKPTGAASGNIAVSATNQSTMVWAPINSSNNGLNVLPYYTTNGGGSWTSCAGIPTGNNFCSQQWSQSKFLVSDRVNGNKFYYYSYDDATQKFYRSTDGGINFSLISTNSLPGNWKMKMDAIPGKEGQLLFCTASGSSLYYSANNGDTWTTIPNVSNCVKFGFGKAIGSSNDVTLFVKATINGVDGIHYSTNNGTSWTNIYGSNIPAGLSDISGDLDEEYTVYFGTSGRGLFYGTVQSGTIYVSSVSVSPTSVSVNVGATQQLTATVAPSNATNKTSSWSSSNTSVATVSSSGLVTGVAIGSATITVTTQDGNKTATSAITVTATSQTPYGGTARVVPGKIEAEDFDNGGQNIAYYDNEASNFGGAYRTTEGVDIQGCGEGGYNLAWTAAGEWLEYTVNVPTSGNYNVEARVASLSVGANITITFSNGNVSTGNMTAGATGDWQTYTTITKTGVALQAGTQIMKVYFNNGDCNFNYVNIAAESTVPVSSVSVTPASASITVGSTQQLTATVAPSNATNKTVSWSSSNTSVATVSSSGLVTAVAAGSATITVTTQDGNKTATSAITVSSSCSLPTGWYTSDIGSVSPAGSACASGSSYTVKGAGTDIWGTADAFRFAYTQVNGDYTITAKVNSLNNTDAWAKAGVMIRETLNANSKNAFMNITPGNGATFQTRTSAGGSTTHTISSGITAPYWVKITRGNNSLKGYISTNGTTWTLIKTTTVTMTSSVYIGLAVTSHAIGTLCTAEFSNVSVQSGLKSTEIDNLLSIDQKGVTEAGFVIYPNPVNSLDRTINIRTNQHFTGSVQLVDEAGRLVYRTGMDNDELSINLGKLRPGLYIVQLSNSQNNYFSKLILR